MTSKSFRPSPKASLPFKAANKEKRQKLHIERKKAQDSIRRDERFRRRRDEDKDPSLRENRLKNNIPLTLERKRVWDEVDRDTGDFLGVSVDTERLKRQKLEEARQADDDDNELDGLEGDKDSMIDADSDNDVEEEIGSAKRSRTRSATERATRDRKSVV